MADLRAAIQAHIADESESGGLLLTDWVLACASVRMDETAEMNTTSYSWWNSGGSYHSVRGLATLLNEWLRDDYA